MMQLAGDRERTAAVLLVARRGRELRRGRGLRRGMGLRCGRRVRTGMTAPARARDRAIRNRSGVGAMGLRREGDSRGGEVRAARTFRS